MPLFYAYTSADLTGCLDLNLKLLKLSKCMDARNNSADKENVFLVADFTFNP